MTCDDIPFDYNYSYSTNFMLIIPKAPEVTFFCTKAPIPSVRGQGAKQISLHADIYHPGDHGDFDDLNVSYLINQDMGNWNELFRWWKEYSMVIEPTPDDISDYDLVCDITLILLSNNKKAIGHWVFYNAFPILITGPEFDSQVTDANPIVGDATFRYTYYDFFPGGDNLLENCPK